MMVKFSYDPWRGGFYLGFLNSGRAYVQSVFNDLMSIHFNNMDQIVAIESFFWGTTAEFHCAGYMGATIFLRVFSKLKGISFALALSNYVKGRRNWNFGLVQVKTFLVLIGLSNMMKV